MAGTALTASGEGEGRRANKMWLPPPPVLEGNKRHIVPITPTQPHVPRPQREQIWFSLQLRGCLSFPSHVQQPPADPAPIGIMYICTPSDQTPGVGSIQGTPSHHRNLHAMKSNLPQDFSPLFPSSFL